MNEKKIVFLGTPKFAACVLEGLINANYNIVGIVSQPDKEIGRKKVLTPTPVKEVAVKYNIPIFQPVSLRKDFSFLYDLAPDMLITAAYGQILPSEVLKIAKINNVNVHGSLLPKYRGGAPIQRAIMNGEKKTGITIMQMVDKMDAGLMYAKRECEIDDNINSTELFEKLQYIGRDLLLEVLPSLLDNSLKGEEQDESQVTFSYNIKKEEEKLNLNDTCVNVINKIRGLANTPCGYAILNSKKMKIYQAIKTEFKNDNKPVGTILITNNNHFNVKCIDGYIELLSIQMEGKQRILASDFLNGYDKKVLANSLLV